MSSNYLERVLIYCYAVRQNQTSARDCQAQESRVCYFFLAYVPISLSTADAIHAWFRHHRLSLPTVPRLSWSPIRPLSNY